PNKKRLILMNKTDVSDVNQNKIWASKIEELSGCKVILTDFQNKNDINKIISKITELSSDIMQKRLEKGLQARAVRTMVIGMPNVGKSSTINRLIKRSKTKTGPKAGVTRTQQWVRINDKIELLDTPGIIPTTQENQKQAQRLACVNSIGDKAYDSEEVAIFLLKELNNLYIKEVQKYFNLQDELTLENIALSKNWLLKEAKPDTKRTSEILLSNFREGKIGKFTLDRIEEFGI
ncbi:ribosome biogenesis GTPase YlqF, partial [bacterium]|nr:ribosome biogenesis GTPase YlqF [bacterium]